MVAALPWWPTKCARLPETRIGAPRRHRRWPGRSAPKSKSVATKVNAAAQAAATEAENSQTIVLALGELRKEVGGLTERSQTIASSAEEAEVAAREVQKGAETIASAAEEQAAAVSEASKSVQSSRRSRLPNARVPRSRSRRWPATSAVRRRMRRAFTTLHRPPNNSRRRSGNLPGAADR